MGTKLGALRPLFSGVFAHRFLSQLFDRFSSIFPCSFWIVFPSISIQISKSPTLTIYRKFTVESHFRTSRDFLKKRPKTLEKTGGKSITNRRRKSSKQNMKIGVKLTSKTGEHRGRAKIVKIHVENNSFFRENCRFWPILPEQPKFWGPGFSENRARKQVGKKVKDCVHEVTWTVGHPERHDRPLP